MAESVSKAQAKLERKRQRKMEKKLAKAQEAEKSPIAQEAVVADTISSEKKSKVISRILIMFSDIHLQFLNFPEVTQ